MTSIQDSASECNIQIPWIFSEVHLLLMATGGHQLPMQTNFVGLLCSFWFEWLCLTVKMFIRSLNITDQALTPLLSFRRDFYLILTKATQTWFQSKFYFFCATLICLQVVSTNIISMCVMVFSRSEEGRLDYSNNHCSLKLQGAQVFSSPCPRCLSLPQSVEWVR